MNLEQLQFIAEINRCESFSKAAEMLHISQPGISQAITSFEKEMGVTLFKRSRKGVYPTQEGTQIINKAEEIMYHIYELKRLTSMYNNLRDTKIVISVVPSLFPSTMIHSLFSFSALFPGVKVELHEKQVQQVINDVSSGFSDIGLIAIYHQDFFELEGLQKELLFKGIVKIGVSGRSSLASKKYLTPMDLKDQLFAVYSGENIQMFIKKFEERFGPLRILFTSNNTSTILQAVSEGIALSILPHTKHFNYESNLKLISLKDYEPLEINYYWIYRNSKLISKAAVEFKKHLTKSIKT